MNDCIDCTKGSLKLNANVLIASFISLSMHNSIKQNLICAYLFQVSVAVNEIYLQGKIYFHYIIVRICTDCIYSQRISY